MIHEIEKVVCKGECVCIDAIHTKSRKRELVLSRQIIMYFTKERDESMTWEKIAGYFGLDHATGIHAHNTITDLIETDKKFKIKMRRYGIKIEGIDLNFESSDMEVIRALENEVLDIENKISKLSHRAKLVMAEIECLYVDVRGEKPVIKIIPFTERRHEIRKKAEVKPEIKPVKIAPEPIRKERHININPMTGAYHGYYEHAL